MFDPVFLLQIVVEPWLETRVSICLKVYIDACQFTWCHFDATNRSFHWNRIYAWCWLVLNEKHPLLGDPRPLLEFLKPLFESLFQIILLSWTLNSWSQDPHRIILLNPQIRCFGQIAADNKADWNPYMLPSSILSRFTQDTEECASASSFQDHTSVNYCEQHFSFVATEITSSGFIGMLKITTCGVFYACIHLAFTVFVASLIIQNLSGGGSLFGLKRHTSFISSGWRISHRILLSVYPLCHDYLRFFNFLQRFCLALGLTSKC